MSIQGLLNQVRRLKEQAKARARAIAGPLATNLCDYLHGRPPAPRLAKRIAKALEAEDDPVEAA